MWTVNTHAQHCRFIFLFLVVLNSVILKFNWPRQEIGFRLENSITHLHPMKVGSFELCWSSITEKGSSNFSAHASPAIQDTKNTLIFLQMYFDQPLPVSVTRQINQDLSGLQMLHYVGSWWNNSTHRAYSCQSIVDVNMSVQLLFVFSFNLLLYILRMMLPVAYHLHTVCMNVVDVHIWIKSLIWTCQL